MGWMSHGCPLLLTTMQCKGGLQEPLRSPHSGISQREERVSPVARFHPLLPPGADTVPSPSSTCGRTLEAFKALSGERRKGRFNSWLEMKGNSPLGAWNEFLVLWSWG